MQERGHWSQREIGGKGRTGRGEFENKDWAKDESNLAEREASEIWEA